MNIEYRKMVRRRRGTSSAAGVYLPEGRLPSTFGVPCSLFDIPAEGGFFFERSLEKDVFTKSDVVFNFSEEKKSTLINDFYMTLLKTTMLKILYEWYINEKYYSYYYRKKTLYMLEKLETMPQLKGPKFVYAHIECPHWPFVFDRDGGPVDPRHFTDLKNKKYYLDQYIFINKKVKHLVEVLIKQSSSPPVIVVQSDHGPRGFEPGGGYYQLDVGNEWQRIFNGYYLPGKDHQGLYPSISPVNTFRLIFNLYFNADYPMLKD